MYDESFVPWWNWLLLLPALVLTAVLLAGAFGLVDFGEQSTGLLFTFAAGALFFWSLVLVFGRYFIRVRGGAVELGYRFWNITLPLEEIRSVQSESVGLMTFGGLGWRMDVRKRIGYVAATGSAVEIVTRTGRTYVATTRDPDAVMRQINAA